MDEKSKNKKFRIGLLGRIAIAIVAGIGIGYISPMWWAQLCATFNGIFSQFLGFLIPLIILGFVAPAIADLGARAGKMLVATALLAYGATIMAGFISYFTGAWLFPGMLSGAAGIEKAGLEQQVEITTYFNIAIPPLMGVMTSLVLAFMLGVDCDSTSSVLYLRHFREHDCGRAGHSHHNGFRQDHRGDFRATYRHTRLAVLYRCMFQSQESFQDALDHDAGLFHRTGNAVVGRHNSRNAPADGEDGG